MCTAKIRKMYILAVRKLSIFTDPKITVNCICVLTKYNVIFPFQDPLDDHSIEDADDVPESILKYMTHVEGKILEFWSVTS